MTGKIFSIVFLLTGMIIGLGAFGHDSHAAHLASVFGQTSVIDPATAKIVIAVWHFCSGCMLAFGTICVGSWHPVRRGIAGSWFAPTVIGLLYVIVGLSTVFYTGVRFFWLFAALGSALLISLSLIWPKRSAMSKFGKHTYHVKT